MLSATYSLRQPAQQATIHSRKNPDFEAQRERSISHTISRNEDVPKIASIIVNKWKIGVPDLLVTFVTGKTDASWWRKVDQATAFQTAMRKLVTGYGGETLFIDDGYNHGASALIASVIRDEDEEIFVEMASKLSVNQTGPGPEIRLLSTVPREASNKTKHLDSLYRSEEECARFIYIDRPYGETGSIQISLEKQLRNELGRHVFKKYTDMRLSDTTKIPPYQFVGQVVVFCNGHVEELDRVIEYINENIPVVVMHGTGALADVLANSKARWTGQDLPELRETIVFYLRRALHGKKRVMLEDDYESIIDKIIALLKSGLLTFVDVTDFEALSNMDAAILTAAIEHIPRIESQYLLEASWGLAVQGNLLSLAETRMIGQQPWRDMEIPRAVLMEALVLPEREAFVELILQRFPIRSFMTHVDYLTLFQNTVNQSFFRNRIYDPVLQHNSNFPINEKFVLVELNEMIYQLTSIRNYINFEELSANALGLGTDDPTAQDGLALRALIVYATLFNRVELIRICIKYCPDPVQQAIFVEHLFRSIAKYNTQPDIHAALAANATEFDKLALEIFDLGYSDSPDRCFALLSSTQAHFGDFTIMELAYHAGSLNFMHYPAMRQFVDEYSYNFIEYKGLHGYIKMFLSAIFIFPMYLWLTFPRLDKYAKTVPYGYIDLDEPRNREEAERIVGEISGRRRESTNHISSKEGSKGPPLHMMIYELWSSPVAKYLIWFVQYHLFLILIGVDIMLPPCMYAGVDYAVFICTACMWLDLALRTIFELLIGRRFDEFRRTFDFIYQTVFNILFFLFRIAPYRENYPFHGRIILAFGVLYYFYSVWTQFMYMMHFTGAYIRLLSKNMVVNLIQWFMLMSPLLISTAVVWQAVGTPDWHFTPDDHDDWRHAFYRSFFTLFGGFYYELDYDPGCEASNKIIWSNFTQPEEAFPQDRCWLGDYNSGYCSTVTVWSYIFVIHYYLLLKLAMITALNAYYLHTNMALLPFAGILGTYKRFEAVLGIAGRSFLPWPFSSLGYLFEILAYQKSKSYDLIKSVDAEKITEGVDQETATYWRAKVMEYFIVKEPAHQA